MKIIIFMVDTKIIRAEQSYDVNTPRIKRKV